jgi:hypothetical protein
MKFTTTVLAAAAAVALLLGGPALAQQDPPQEPEPPQSPTKFKQLDSDRVRQLPPPSERASAVFDGASLTPHERLARFLGTWDVQGQVWVAPDADPVPANGTAILEWALEDRFLYMRFKGEMLGETFVGVGYDTWNEPRGKHVGVWMDSAGTEIYHYEGDWDESGNVLTVFGEAYDPEAKKMIKTKAVTTFRSSSMYTYESYRQDDAGEWVKEMASMFGKLK